MSYFPVWNSGEEGLKTFVAGEASEVEELEVLLQAASEGSEDIQLERSLRTIRLIPGKLLGISVS